MPRKSKPVPSSQPATMRDVARLAGVSLATVSRTLDGSSLVTNETSLRVKQAAAQLSFVPNISARTLKYGQSHAIGVIVPDLANPFFSEFLHDFEALTTANRQVVLLANAESNTAGTGDSIRQMLMRAVDGVVIMPSLDELEPYQLLAMRKVPAVAIDSRRVGRHLSDVSLMHEDGMEKAVSYLKQLGHTRIGFIGGSEGLAISRLRHQAFCSALQVHAMPFLPEFVRAGDYRAEGGDREMRQLLTFKSPPTAVVTINDLSAIGAIRAAHSLGRSVPKDVSIIGFDGIAIGEYVQPSLTTISVSRRLMAEACHVAIETLRMNPGSTGQQLYVPTELIVRESTARPRGAREE